MTSPQIENGHVKIANELVEQFARINLSNYEWRVLMVILRKTYGWNKKSDTISLSQFSDGTGIPTQHISATLKRLVSKNLIIKTNGKKVMEYGLQKDYSKWSPLLTPVVPTQVVHMGVIPNPVLPEQVLQVTSTGTTDSGSAATTDSSSTPRLVGTTYASSNKRHIKDTITKDSENGGILFGKLATIYENNIGLLTPMVAEELKIIADDYPDGWFEEAVKIACLNNKRNIKYVNGILNRFKSEGFKKDSPKPVVKQRWGETW